MTNPDINGKLEIGKCETVRFSYRLKIVFCMANFSSHVMLEINLLAKMVVKDHEYLEVLRVIYCTGKLKITN